MRAIDWKAMPLGSISAWPQSLLTLIDVMPGARQPMFVVWGPERIMLYNDRYARICGAKHPRALGRRFVEVWADILRDIGPIMDRAYAGESIHVDGIQVDDRPSAVEIRIVDTGVGIEAANPPRLFDLFLQLDVTFDRAHGGLGIGLVLVRHLAEMHGGKVWVSSPGKGRGATFTVRLPRTKAAA